MTTGTTPTAAALKGTSTVRARCGGALATLALVLGVLTGVVPGSSAGATGPPHSPASPKSRLAPCTRAPC